MNAAVHTSTRVHRCRADILGTSATCLTTPSELRAQSTADMHRSSSFLEVRAED